MMNEKNQIRVIVSVENGQIKAVASDQPVSISVLNYDALDAKLEDEFHNLPEWKAV